jgi:peptide/nickel transport system substrate-binding protein
MASRSIATIGSLAVLLFVSSLHAQTLRVGMTTTDLPTTGGIPDNGSEGGRFAGYTMYDALVNWDFTKVDKSADLTPGPILPIRKPGYSQSGKALNSTTAAC